MSDQPVPGGVLRDAVYKLRRIRRVKAAQYALDTDVGQMALVKFMGQKMDERTRATMSAWCVKALAEEGHTGVTVEVTFHTDRRTVELTAHAEDKR